MVVLHRSLRSASQSRWSSLESQRVVGSEDIVTAAVEDYQSSIGRCCEVGYIDAIARGRSGKESEGTAFIRGNVVCFRVVDFHGAYCPQGTFSAVLRVHLKRLPRWPAVACPLRSSSHRLHGLKELGESKPRETANAQFTEDEWRCIHLAEFHSRLEGLQDDQAVLEFA